MIGIYIKVDGESHYKVREQMQLDSCKELAEGEQVEIYSDIGNVRISREKLLENIEEGNISKIITYDFSRLSRDIKETMGFLEFLKSKNVKFITVKDGEINKEF